VKESDLSKHLRNAQYALYRKLVRQHCKSAGWSAGPLVGTVQAELAGLPDGMQDTVIRFIDELNVDMGNPVFWRVSTCEDAFLRTMKIAIRIFGSASTFDGAQEAFRSEHHELAFTLYQVATLSWAYTAVLEPATRRAMGIKKGWIF